MTCEKIRELLYDFRFDLLDEAERLEVANHLGSCEACREAYERTGREQKLLDRWTVEAPPEDLLARTEAATRAAAAARLASGRQGGPALATYAPVEREWKWLGSRRFWLATGAAAAIILTAFLVQAMSIVTRKAGTQEAFVYGQSRLAPGHAAAYRVYVRSGQTAEPIRGAAVRAMLVSDKGAAIWQTRLATDERGFAEVTPEVPEAAPEGTYSLKILTTSADGDADVVRPVEVKRAFRIMVTTDKPLYQPGQVIHLRTLALALADLKPVAGRDVLIEVQDAKGNKVFKQQAPASEFGIASADFTLADQVNQGDYTVSAAIGDTRSERTVRVEPYVLPKFRIDLATERGFYMPGDTIAGDLTAEYTFGKPVAGARVKIVLAEFIHEFQPFSSLTGKTDSDGKFHFLLPLKAAFVGQELKKGDAFISLEATVTDSADHVQKKTLDRTVTASAIHVDAFPESGRLVRGVENILYIVTAYPDGRPAKTHLRLGSSRQETRTSDAGIAKVKLTPDSDKLQLTIDAEDDTGQRVRVTRALAVGPATETVLLRTDKAVYRTGETAQVTILSADRTGPVFLDVIKDQRAALTKTVDVKDGQGAVALDLPADLFGTLELHAYRIAADGNIAGDMRLVQVNRADDLKIQATLNQTTYQPAEKALLDFLVTRSDGSPAQAALSLAGVDEAVFALQEARPGLERVYFMLQEEILKPRYEIHAAMPEAPATVLDNAPPTPERQEATVVLFAAASDVGGKLVERTAGEPLQARQTRYREESEKQKQGVVAAATLTSLGLFILAVLPLVIYALAKTVRQRPITDVPQGEVERLWSVMRRLGRWWILGLYLPLAGLVLGIMIDPENREEAGAAVAVAAGLVVLAALVIYVGHFRRERASRVVPLLRKLIPMVPVAYGLGGLAVLLVALAKSGVISAGMSYVLIIMTIAIASLVLSVLAIAARCLAERVSLGRWLWLAVSRAAYAVLPGLLVVGLLIPAHSWARSVWSEAKSAPSGVDFGAKAADWADPRGAATEMAMQPAGAALRMPTKTPPSPMLAATAHPASPDADTLKAPPRIRNFFPETLLWRPELITDEKGRAHLELPLADSITTWRIGASAVSRQGELGDTALPLRVFQDFFVDIDLPVALTQNDQVSVPIAIYNYLDKAQTVRLDVARAEGFQLLDEPSKTVRMEAHEIRAVALRLKAVRPGRQKLLVKAFGSEMSDAIERTVTVRPDGREVVHTENGRLAGTVKHEIEIPAGAVDGASDLVVKIYPGSFSQVVEGLDNIFKMPYGCFEQTSSVTYPNVLVLDYLRRMKMARPEVELKALNFINLGYQRLLSYEVKGGGFEWFGKDPAHLVLTAYGLMEFQDMSKVYSVDPKVIERTRGWLLSRQGDDGSWTPPDHGIAEGAINAMQGQPLRTTAYVAWALAATGKVDAGTARALDYIAAKADDSADTYTLGLCASAMVAAKRGEAERFLKILDARKTVEGDLVHWASAGQGATFSRGAVLEIETTAIAAQALLSSGHDAATANKALAWLIAHKDSSGTWQSTQATVQAMRALLAGAEHAGSVDGKMTVAVIVNGKAAEDVVITPENADVFRLVDLKPFVAAGANTVTLETAGKGSLAYQIVATHYMPWGKDAPAAGGDKEMTIDVAYDTTTLKTSDLLTARVTLRYNRPGTANMTLVDLGLPPGFDVVPDAFKKMKDAGTIERYTMTGRQVILYFREISAGRPVTFTYQLRAKFPVKAKTPPTSAYQYYEPAIRAESAPVTLTVI